MLDEVLWSSPNIWAHKRAELHSDCSSCPAITKLIELGLDQHLLDRLAQQRPAQTMCNLNFLGSLPLVSYNLQSSTILKYSFQWGALKEFGDPHMTATRSTVQIDQGVVSWLPWWLTKYPTRGLWWETNGFSLNVGPFPDSQPPTNVGFYFDQFLQNLKSTAITPCILIKEAVSICYDPLLLLYSSSSPAQIYQWGCDHMQWIFS